MRMGVHRQAAATATAPGAADGGVLGSGMSLTVPLRMMISDSAGAPAVTMVSPALYSVTSTANRRSSTAPSVRLLNGWNWRSHMDSLRTVASASRMPSFMPLLGVSGNPAMEDAAA
jgi:hypothetical protein